MVNCLYFLLCDIVQFISMFSLDAFIKFCTKEAFQAMLLTIHGSAGCYLPIRVQNLRPKRA